MYVNVIICSNKLLFVWSTLKKGKKENEVVETNDPTCMQRF